MEFNLKSDESGNIDISDIPESLKDKFDDYLYEEEME